MADKLFSDLNLSHKPSRNGFNLSHDLKFTAKAGELLPTFHLNIMPNDSVQIKINHQTRTAPVQTAAYTQIKEYFDVFFVPYRINWKQLPQILIQNIKNPVIANSMTGNKIVGTQVPQISSVALFGSVNHVRAVYGEYTFKSIISRLSTENVVGTNYFGFNRGLLSLKLLNHLGYCHVTESELNDEVLGLESDGYLFSYYPNMSLLPLLAYNAIYYFFFRNTLWENNQPYNYNVDYLDSTGVLNFLSIDNNDEFWKQPTMFDLKYSIYPKDIFFGILPNSQYGDPAMIGSDEEVNQFYPLSTRDSSLVNDGIYPGVLASQNDGYIVDVNNNNLSSTLDANNQVDQSYQLGVSLSAFRSAISVLELRKSNFLQRYKEIVGSGAVDYANLVRKIFGVEVSFQNSNTPRYLGGTSSVINISEVVNTNLADGNEALIKGKGYGSGGSDTITFDAGDEFGCLMCIYHAQPVLDYNLNSFDFDVLKTEVDDFANPVFDRLGFQSLPLYYFINKVEDYVLPSDGVTNYTLPTLGYTTRYFDYKTRVNRVVGGFANGNIELGSWYTAVDSDYIKSFLTTQINGSTLETNLNLNSNFFHVNPRILDSIFTLDADSSVDTDQLRINAHFEIHAVRNLDYKGVPF